MASRYAAAAGRRNSPIDLPLAAVAALAVGFAAFVVPDSILSRIVEGSGLPGILSAAQPPLGTTARVCVAAVAALATFGTVFMLLRLLGGSAGKVPRREPEPGLPFDAAEGHTIVTPKLRRADIHPDAPARRPILATRELGEPDLRQRAPAPDPVPVIVAEEPEFEAEAAPAPEPEPEPACEIVREEEASEAVAIVPLLDELELSGADIQIIAAVQEPVAEAPPPAAADAAPVAAEPSGDASIPDLMARLERGLARRLHHQPLDRPVPERPQPLRAPPAEPAAAVQSGGGDDRLRSAIENLQKMAARAG